MKLSHLILTGLIVTSGSLVSAESLLHDFTQANPTPSLETLIAFLHEHRHEPNLCNVVTLTLTLERTDETSSADWKNVADITSDMITIFKTLENNDDDTTRLETFGPPFKEWYQKSSDKTGIHGSITITAGNKQDEPQDLNEAKKIGIKISMYHEKEYNQNTWNQILDDSLMFIEQVRNNRHAVKGLGVPLQTIINTEHTSKDLTISMEDNNHDKLN